MKVSIIIPVYNEATTLETVVKAVTTVDVGLEKEIICVDDCSFDRSRDVLLRLEKDMENLRVILHKMNKGKGAALRTGFNCATGDILLVQDADLEYEPSEYPNLLAPILAGKADVVYGSRFLGGGSHRVLYFWHYVGNKLVTLCSNMMTNLNLTDVEVCYKAFRREVLSSFTLKENRFGFEVEVTAKVARGEWRIYEVPISYYGRTYAEGKKITWKDGLRAMWCILKYRCSE